MITITKDITTRLMSDMIIRTRLFIITTNTIITMVTITRLIQGTHILLLCTITMNIIARTRDIPMLTRDMTIRTRGIVTHTRVHTTTHTKMVMQQVRL